MSADPAAPAEQGIDLSQSFPEPPAPAEKITVEEAGRPASAPAEQPASSDAGKAAVDIFAERLEQYKDAEDAKKHFKEIAAALKCSSQLGYKALKKVPKFNTKAEKPTQATIKIKKEPVTDDGDQPPASNPPEPDVIYTPPPTPNPNIYNPPPTIPVQPTQMTEELLGKASKSLWNGLCDLAGGEDAKDAYLSKEEATELAGYLNPILQARAPSLVNNPEIIGGIGVMSIMAPKAKLLMDARKRRKQAEEEQPQQLPPSQPAPFNNYTGEPNPAPTPAPAETTPQTTSTEPAETKPPAEPSFKHGKPSFYNHLG